MVYKLLLLDYPVEDEREFDDLESAERAAVENCYDDSAWGVYDDDIEDEETNHVVAIA